MHIFYLEHDFSNSNLKIIKNSRYKLKKPQTNKQKKKDFGRKFYVIVGNYQRDVLTLTFLYIFAHKGVIFSIQFSARNLTGYNL